MVSTSAPSGSCARSGAAGRTVSPAPASAAATSTRRTGRVLRLGAGQGPELQPFTIERGIHLDFVAATEVPLQDLLGQRVLDEPLDGALQGPRAVVLVVAVLHQEVRARVGEAQGELFLGEPQ